MGLSYEQVFENNRKWAAETRASDKEFFIRQSQLQIPDYLYIGCSDSRVPAEIFMGAEPGEVFVHRNIANQVSQTDRNAVSVVRFAVNQLQVKHIVVCGHFGCGGVQAAMEERTEDPLEHWFDQIRAVVVPHLEELEQLNDEEERYRRMVELNVEAQCRNLLEFEVVQEAIKKRGGPSVHAWVYDIHTGILIDLDFKY